MLKLLLKSAHRWHEVQVLKVCHRSFKFLNVQNNVNRLLPSHKHYRTSSITLNTRIAQEKSTYGRDEDWVKAEDNEDAIAGALENFNISSETIHRLNDIGIKFLFPVQTNTYEAIYEGSDVIVQARTGSGKTMSYALPLIERLKQSCDFNERSRSPKILVLAPTRELANQVSQVISSLSQQIRVVPVFGGASITVQEKMLMRGVDVVVATPGRLLDLLSRRTVSLHKLEHVVLDEVDRMLDMGFAEDVEKILHFRYKKDRSSNPQTLLFSATVPSWVQRTAEKYLSRDLKKLDLIGVNSNKTSVSVQHTAMKCSKEQRINAILDLMNKQHDGEGVNRTIVFCQTKREVDNLGHKLSNKAVMLHGDFSQSSRDTSLRRFKSGEVNCMVATDVAARGIDIPDVDLVIQCSPPPDVEAFIHRSGRTGRAGKTGLCVLLYTDEEADDVARVESIAKFKFERMEYKRSEEAIKKDISRQLRYVNSRVMKKHEELKNKLIEEFGEENLLSASVALLANYTPKSLITHKYGYTTMQLSHSNQSINFTNPSQVISLIKSFLPDDVFYSIRDLSICSDLKSAVFDIPSNKEDFFMQAWNLQSKPYNITVPDTLPPIIRKPMHSSRDYNANRNNYTRYSDRRSSSFNSRDDYFGKRPARGDYYGKRPGRNYRDHPLEYSSSFKSLID